MKHRKGIGLSLLLCMTWTAGLLHAAEGDVYALLDDLNLRQGPGSFYALNSTVAEGEHAIELGSSGEWKKIRLSASGKVGWVHAPSLAPVSVVIQEGIVVAENQPQPSFQATDVLVEANQLEQTMTPSTQSVEGEAVSPMFEEGAISQGDKVRVATSQVTEAVKIEINADKDLSHFSSSAKLKEDADVQADMMKSDVVKPDAILPVELSEISDQGVAAAKPAFVAETNKTKKVDVQPTQQPMVKLDLPREAVIKPVAEPVKDKQVDAASKVVVLGQTNQVLMQTTVIRKEPSALSDMLGWVGSGTQVQSIDQKDKWVKVRVLDSDRIGWIEMAALASPDVSDDSTMLRPKQQQKLPQKVETQPAAVVNKGADAMPDAGKEIEAKAKEKPTTVAATEKTAKNHYTFNKKAKLRAGPDVKFDTVSWAGVGSQATLLGRKGDWLRIQMQVSKRIGWVYYSSLDMMTSGVARAAGSLAAAVIGSGLKAMPVDSPPATKASKEANKETIVAGNAAPVQAGVESVAATTASHVYRFDRSSNLRAGPDTKYDAVAWGEQGSYAVGLDRKGEWILVQLRKDKRKGWVFQRSLKLVRADSAMAKKAIEKSDVQAGRQLYFFKRTSTLRAGAGKQYDKVGWGGRNESAQHIELQGDWTRVRMSISGKVGWVFNSYLVRAVDSGRVITAYRPRVTQATANAGVVQSGFIYEVVRTSALHTDANEFSGMIGSVEKGDSVVWLEDNKGWVRVNPQLHGSKVGWIKEASLKRINIQQVGHKAALISKKSLEYYKGKISKGETFNFSYAALEEALYKVPVEDIHIRMDDDDLKALFLKRQYDKSPFDIKIKTGRHRLHGTVKVLGSSTRIFKKKSLLIKLDKESTRWYGHRRLALRSMASDKALMREWMAWKMMAALGMKVPEVHFTRVTFNHGEKTGLYLSIEWMGAEFLEANELDAGGEFYQPNDASHCGDLYSTDQIPFCFSKITPQNDDYSNLKAMATAMNAATASNIDETLATHFDVESVINWIAVNSLVTNGDTYNKNYWLYFHPSTKKWTMIPWDYNLTFGRTYDQYGMPEFKIFNDNFQYYYPPDVGAGNPIKDKALRNPKLRAQLEAKIKHLTGMEPNGPEHTFGWFSPTVMHARIGNLATVVGKEVYKDTFLSYDAGDFTKTYESLMHYVTAHDHFLKVKLFGDFDWHPSEPNQPLVSTPLPDVLLGRGQAAAGAESLHMVDRSWGYFVGRLDLHQPLQSKATFEVRIEGASTPKDLPVAQSPRRCIERSWILKTTTPNVSVMANVMFEYIQENSRRSEVPPTVHEEFLELWMLDGNRWNPMQTEVNEYSNTLTAKHVRVKSGRTYRFVACSPF